MSDNLTEQVGHTIGLYGMLGVGDRILVALSGGPDSVCLLNVLEELKSQYSLQLFVAHFNHKLRGKASDGDAAFAEGIAHEKGLLFLESSADVRIFAEQEKLSIEEAARKLRYEFLLRSAGTVGANKVAVGHTADDQAETVLMRLIRGAGPRGLAGIPPVRRLGDSEEPKIIRPLIGVWRSDVMQYVKKRHLNYRTDESNDSKEYLRNRIRLELIPHLQEEFNPQITRRLERAAATLANENDFIETEARLIAGEIILEKRPGWVLFDIGFLKTLHPALRNRILTALIGVCKADGPMIEAERFDEVNIMLAAGKGRLDLPGRLRLEVSEGFGLISHAAQRPKALKKIFDITIEGKTTILEMNLAIKTKVMAEIASPSRLAGMCNPNRQYFDADTVRPPLEIRFRRAGDSFSPLGARGSKKLKDFFIDKKIPRFLRDHVPLLLSNGKIMWVMGYAIDKKFSLKPNSSAAFRVDYARLQP